eukprot:9008079-Pyramimonas_sp.AAC.1
MGRRRRRRKRRRRMREEAAEEEALQRYRRAAARTAERLISLRSLQEEGPDASNCGTWDWFVIVKMMTVMMTVMAVM